MNPRTSIPSNTLSGSASPGSLGEPLYRFPTSLAQQSFWYLDRLEPGNPCWNIAVRFRIKGPLDVSILERCVNEIVRRHEILRVSFALVDGALAQIVHAEGTISLPLDDLSHLPSPARDAEEERRTIAEAALPFDLKTGPLLRARILKLAEQEHMFLLGELQDASSQKGTGLEIKRQSGLRYGSPFFFCVTSGRGKVAQVVQ